MKVTQSELVDAKLELLRAMVTKGKKPKGQRAAKGKK